MNRDGMESYIKLGNHFVPLDAYRLRRADKLMEGIKAVAFLGILSLVAFLMLWGMP
jgi:hypothetical protein